MKRFLLAAALLLVLGGCTHYYVHPTKKSPAEFDRDKRDCEKIAEREVARKGVKPCDAVEQCLITMKGWRRR